ncbi:MAG: hypothetical protein WCX84_03810 [Syntrophales bacterium]|nr:hypothetical protein [Syntrophales bacterium]NLN60474.1 hypothetical protein [Deltaproteobacteria bacterium]
MKNEKRVCRKLAVSLVVLVVFFFAGTAPAQVTGATQGSVALNLASLLGVSLPANATGQNAVDALSALGISPESGWNANATADSNFISSLYKAVLTAFNTGKIAPKSGAHAPSSLVAAACTSANISQSSCVDAIRNAGGSGDAAAQGAGFGLSAPGGPIYYGPGFDGTRPGSGGGGGGVTPRPTPSPSH